MNVFHAVTERIWKSRGTMKKIQLKHYWGFPQWVMLGPIASINIYALFRVAMTKRKEVVGWQRTTPGSEYFKKLISLPIFLLVVQ